MKRTLLIIDGHNFLFKAYGVPFKFNSKKGTPLHVVTTYTSLIRRAVNATKCTDIAIVFDTEGKTSNHDLSDEYKANRKLDYSNDEDSPFKHLPYIKKVLSYLKIKSFEKRGIEADDIVASLATQYLNQHEGGKVVIASSDSDFYQLLSNKVSILHFGNKGVNVFFTTKSLKEKLSITPKQYVFFKSLTGDSADNIVGVAGIGKIRAKNIVNKVIPFDIVPHKSLLERNEKLVRLNSEINVCKNWKTLELNTRISTMKNQDIFFKLQF